MTSKFIKRLLWIFVPLLLFTASGGAADWPQFQRDATNSGLTVDGLPTDPLVIWSADLHRIDVPPVVFSGAVYVLAGNGTLWALDKRTGDAIWKSQMDGWVFQTSTPACDGDRIYAATDSGYLAAFAAKTGRMIWTHHLTENRFECPITCADGRIYLGEGSAYGKGPKRYLCFDQNGNEGWNLTRETHGYMWCGASLVGDFLVYGDSDGTLLSVDRKNGTLVDLLELADGSKIGFARPDPGRVRNSLSYKGGYVYTASELSADTGYAWKIGFDEATGRFVDAGWSSPVGFSTSAPVVYNGRVYLGVGEHGHPGALVCLDDASGDTVWSYPVDAGVKSSPVVSASGDLPRISFTTAKVNGSAYCIEDAGSEPRTVWKFNPPDSGYILAGVAASDGCVFFGTEKGHLYCLSDQAGDDWSQFHLNPSHTGSSVSKAPRTNQTAWITDDINALAGSSVTVAGDKVFVNCVDVLVCLDEFTGETLWNVSFEQNSDVCCSWFTPVYHDGKVFFTGMKTICLDAEDGREIWSFVPPSGRGAVDGSPAIVDGKVVVSDWDGHHYYCLDEATGDELWNFTVDGSAQSTPAIYGDKVVFGSWEWGLGGNIYCVCLDDGTEVWNITTENSPCGSAAIEYGVVYMTTYDFNGDGDLLALALDDGSTIWREAISPTDSTPTLADGKVYVCGGVEGFSRLLMYCFDADDGNLIWVTDPGDKIGDWRCSMAYADGLVFVGKAAFTDFGGTYALDAVCGEQVWSYPGGGSSPAVADGMIFTVGNGKVYAFSDPDAATGI